jgi:hypothetical protein
MKTCPYALTSLVLGILGLLAFCVAPLFAIPAVICGHLGLSKIKAKAHLTGNGLAIGGLIMGYLSIVCFILMLVLFGFIGEAVEDAQVEAGKWVCMNNLHQIEMAKEMWAIDNAKETGDMPTQEEIFSYMGVTTEPLECPEGGTYSVNPLGENPTCSIEGHVLE